MKVLKFHSIKEIERYIINNNLKDIDWKIISKFQFLPIKFIEKYKDKLDWSLMSKFQKLSEPFMEKNKDKINWGNIQKYQKISEEFIQRNCNKISIQNALDCQEVSMEFIEENIRHVSWENISINQKLSESFIEKYKDKLDWNNIIKHQSLSESFIEKYKDKFSWNAITKYQFFSESFIYKYEDNVNWSWVSANQKLSEIFIKKNKEKVCWWAISKYQELSESFIEEHKDLVDWPWISANQKLSESFIEKHKDLVDWKEIFKWQKLSKSFIKKYSKYKNKKNNSLDLYSNLEKEVIGQNKTIKQLSETIKRSKVGLNDSNKPIGVFLFVGFSGTGKTLVAKKISENYFDNKIIRLDMSEYMERHTISRIIGSPPGYVGYVEGCQITKQIKENPKSVVLLDEIEKAHPDVLNVFLQIFDEGQMTDSHGNLVDFRNTIIIMTSNLSTNKLNKQKKMGFKSDEQTNIEVKDFLMSEVKKHFSTEFINRFDDIIVFNKLSKKDIYNIFDIEFKKTVKKAKDIGYDIEINEKAKEKICEEGYSEEYGARYLCRAIKKRVEIPLANKILSEDLDKNKKILISCEKEKIMIKSLKMAVLSLT